jgi:molybdate transport system regulatory protein
MKISQPKHKTKKRKRNSPHGRNENKYSTHGRISISKKAEPFPGYGRVALLERIKDYGSITKAAKSMGMSYRNAWELVASMNKLSKKPLVDRFTGGKGGGGTVVTEHGKKAIVLFWKLRSDLMAFLKKKEKELLELND